ncbi:MAG: outer-membrane lipoprotein carrier protein LolA [Bacteroidetes bacterium]|nr:outer-membrane lipoprotein carrier protein LolA [Bacteroidota bacterium]
MLSFTRKIVGAAAVGLLMGIGQGNAQSSDDVIERLRTRYDAVQAMRATFSQTTSSTFLDNVEHFEGDILIQGDQYRIEMSNQTIVTNTIVSWVFNRSENQVLINDYELDENTFSLTTFLDEFDSAYDVVSYERKDKLDVLALRPQDPLSMFRDVTLWADGDIVVRLDVVDMNDVKMKFELSDIQFNPELSDQTFIFSIPNGVEVIDLREN